MKKKLSIIVIGLIAITMCTGCVMSAGPAELDAAYQLKDVSEYKFEVANDMYIEDPLSNTHAAAEYVEAIAVEEGDPRLANTYTYEELAACFTVVKELNASNLGEYFSLETLPDNDEYNKIQMNAKEGFYIANVLIMNFMSKNGGYEQQQYEPLWMGGSLGACEKKDKSWTTEKFKTVELEGKSYIYTFSPTGEMWTNYEGTQTIYVATQKENSYGEYTLLEAYENNPTEISYLLRVISETGLLGGGSSSTTPDGGNTPDEGNTPDGGNIPESGNKPDNGSSEQTPAVQFEGVYWYLTEDLDGEGHGRDGFYLDGKGNYIQVSKSEQNNFYKEERWTYSNLKSKTVADGVQFTFDIYNKKYNVSSVATYVVGYDGKIKHEINENDWGGIWYYAPVDKATFYSKPAGYVEEQYYEYAFMGCYFRQATDTWQLLDYGVYFDDSYAYVKKADGSTEKCSYTFADKANGFYLLTLSNGDEFYYRPGGIIDIMQQGSKVGQMAVCDKAMYDAIGAN